MTERRFAVVGGGIAGLAAAWELRDHGDVTIFEPDHVGGKLVTGTFQGRPVDLGPDAFLTRVPDAVRLCEELDLTGSLVAPTTGAARLATRTGTVALPPGLVLGAPRQLSGVARSGILSPTGMVRAALDLVLPARSLPEDLSVHELISRRFGAQVADRLVDPLVGGIHAGRTEELSAAATVPQLLAAARRSRSLVRALGQGPAAGSGPMFLTPSGGLADLADAVLAGVEKAGGHLERLTVKEIRSAGPGRAAVDGTSFDGVVVATDATTAAALLGEHAHPALRTIPRASVAVTLLGYFARELEAPPGVSGVLVPRSTGRVMTALSFASAKWPHWAAPGTTLLRVSAGRHGDDRADRLDDEALTERLVSEVGEVLGTSATPVAEQVVRWPGAFPQYLVGHLSRVDEVEAALGRSGVPVALAGSSYRGSGIPACIASGRRAARSLVSGT